jgi:hypothetical protein
MLVGPANVGRHDLENDAVMDFLAGRIAEDRKVDLLDLYFAGLYVDHAAIGRHIGRHPELLVVCDPVLSDKA